ncbi:MAG: hypothetical protein JNK05_30545 [Myxococcales bacterium]|nr:hypothetical protein [Myxococcales bacterium]
MTTKRAPKQPSESTDWIEPVAPRTDATLVAREGEVTNATDATGLEQGSWITRGGNGTSAELHYRDGWIEGPIRYFHANGVLSHEGETRAARAIYPDGPKGKRLATAYANSIGGVGSSHYVGVARWFDPSGACTSEVHYDDEGRRHGAERRWNPHGQLLDEKHWHHGVLHGPQRTRDDKGVMRLLEIEHGVPKLDAKTTKSLLGKVAKAQNNADKIARAIGEFVPRECVAPLAYALIRSGQWSPLAHGEAGFRLLSEYDGAYTADDASAWIELAASNPASSQWWPSLRGWPAVLDRIVERVYALTDDGRWQALAERLPAPMAVGVHFVRARLGATLTDAQRTAVSDAFAEALIAGHYAVERAVEFVDRDGVRAKPGDDLDAYVRSIAARLGDDASFGAALGRAADRGVACNGNYLSAVYPRLSSGPLGRLLSRVDPYNGDAWGALRRVEFRPLAFWAEVLAAMSDHTGRPVARDAIADMVFILAARAARREGVGLPSAFDALVKLEFARTAIPYQGAREMRDALTVLPAERVHALVSQWIDRPMHMFQSAALLVSVAPTNELLAKLCARCNEYASKQTTRAALAGVSFVGIVGAAGREAFVAEYERGDGDRKVLYAHVILSMLAEIGRRGGSAPAQLDRFIDVHACEGVERDAFALEHVVGGLVPDALRALSLERAEAIVLASLDGARKHWTAGFLLLSSVATDAVVARSAALFRERALSLSSPDRLLQIGLAKLDPRAKVAFARAVLADAGAERSALRTALRSYVPVEHIEAAEGARHAYVARAAAIAERARRLSDRLPGDKQPQYVLGVIDEDATREHVSRSGGAAIGVSDARWPQLGARPMRHLLTIDLADAPALRERCEGKDVRAIAVFAPIGAGRRAIEAVAKGAVVLLSAEDLASGENFAHASPRDRATRVRVDRVDVPSWLGEVESKWPEGDELRATARALREALASADGRAMGEPFEERERRAARGGGAFLFQFDDRLVDVALGDRTKVYVYRDGLRAQQSGGAWDDWGDDDERDEP